MEASQVKSQSARQKDTKNPSEGSKGRWAEVAANYGLRVGKGMISAGKIVKGRKTMARKLVARR